MTTRTKNCHKYHVGINYLNILKIIYKTYIRKSGNDIKSDMESFEHLPRWMQACIPKCFNAKNAFLGV